MPYEDSYVAKIRAWVGHDFELVMPTTDVVIENQQGELLMIYNRDFAGWAFPGGYVEPELSWQENAAREATEEAGIIADPAQLQLIGSVSGRQFVAAYPNGDRAKLYTNIFYLTDWVTEQRAIDETEIDAKKWVAPQTIDHMHLTFAGQAVYRLYKKFKATQTVQVLTLDSALQRFVDAQNGEIAGVNSFSDAQTEISQGQKQTHWMWYVLPQLRVLGHSERATYYGIADAQEARDYLADELLRTRLETIVGLTLTLTGNDPVAVFGAVDTPKFQACLTLFDQMADNTDLYQRALDKYFAGVKHSETVALLAQ